MSLYGPGMDRGGSLPPFKGRLLPPLLYLLLLPLLTLPFTFPLIKPPPTPSCFPSVVFLPFLSPLITPSLSVSLPLCAFITYPPKWGRNGVIFLRMWWGSGLFWGSRVVQARQRGRKLEGRRFSPPHALTMRTEQRRGSSQARAGERERPQASSTHLETHTHTHTPTHTHTHARTHTCFFYTSALTHPLRKINTHASRHMYTLLGSHAPTSIHDCAHTRTTRLQLQAQEFKRGEFIMSCFKWLMPFRWHSQMPADRQMDGQTVCT